MFCRAAFGGIVPRECRIRFRRFRLISIDTHLWSECDKQMVDIEKHDVKTTSVNLISSLLAAFGRQSSESATVHQKAFHVQEYFLL